MAVTDPVVLSAFVVLLNVRPAVPPVLPASLNCTLVLTPAGAVVDVTPVSPAPLPTNKLAATLPTTLTPPDSGKITVLATTLPDIRIPVPPVAF